MSLSIIKAGLPVSKFHSLDKMASSKHVEPCQALLANALLKDIHDRMPVVLQPADYDLWLDSGVTDPPKVADLLTPFDARFMRVLHGPAQSSLF